MHGSRKVTSGKYLGGNRVWPLWQKIVNRSPYRLKASSNANGSATSSPSACSQSKNAKESGSISALIRSSEYVVPTATSSLHPAGGRSSSMRCCLSSGLSISCLQAVENVAQQSLTDSPPEFQLCRAGIPIPQFLCTRVVYAGQTLF